MKKFTEFLEKHVVPFANVIGNQKHLRAVRAGIIATLPLTIVGSFFIVFLNIPIPAYTEFIAPYRPILDIPFRLTVGMMSVYASFAIAHFMSKEYKLDSVTCGFLGLLAFLGTTVVPSVSTGADTAVPIGRYINIGQLGAVNLFSAILCSLLAVEIYRFMKEKNITVKMPEGVPEGVANSFSALLPAAVIIVIFWGIRNILKIEINLIIGLLLSPLKGFLVGNNLFGALIAIFIPSIFWLFGIHGVSIMGPIMRPLYDTAIAENMEAFAAGVSAYNMPNFFTEQFFQWFVLIGGSGATIGLAIHLLFSKSKYLKQLGKISIIPAIFNINEPIIFGAPIVLNPILAIPFVSTPIILSLIAFVTTKLGIVPMMVARLPFTIPAPIAAFMSTNWSVAAAILSVISIIISFLIYYPFFKLFEKQALENEKNENK